MTAPRLRPLRRVDELFVLRAIALAADWRPGVDPRSLDDVAASPELAHYVPPTSDPRELPVRHLVVDP